MTAIARPPRALAALALLALAACGDEIPEPDPSVPVVAFDTARALILTESDTIPLQVELALEPQQWSMGFMERERVPEGEGMLFEFSEERPATATFWMFRTLVPLDIAYLDEEGTIVATRTMHPCTSPEATWCERYPAGAPYHSALEVPAGYLARKGVGVGDRVVRVPG